ncbi:hypothetical protein, partial [Halorhodospira sp. 9622]|uniref:hypothetical protein n=1 Tax=Halorhodospira sp. 9622 TaxID=2899136 RepID=UPI001EE7EE36
VVWSLSVDQVTDGVDAGALASDSDVNVSDSYEAIVQDGISAAGGQSNWMPDVLNDTAGDPLVDYQTLEVTSQWDADEHDTLQLGSGASIGDSASDAYVDLLVLEGGTDEELTLYGWSDSDTTQDAYQISVRIEDDAELDVTAIATTSSDSPVAAHYDTIHFAGGESEITLHDGSNSDSVEQTLEIVPDGFGVTIRNFDDGNSTAGDFGDTIRLDDGNVGLERVQQIDDGFTVDSAELTTSDFDDLSGGDLTNIAGDTADGAISSSDISAGEAYYAIGHDGNGGTDSETGYLYKLTVGSSGDVDDIASAEFVAELEDTLSYDGAGEFDELHADNFEFDGLV